MDHEQEQRFIKAFVRRERRTRAQFELSSPKKRGAFLNRLCHDYQEYLDHRYLQPLALPNSDYRDILRELRQRQAPDQCYCISTIADLDGQCCPLADALAGAVGFGLPTILVVIPERLCYFEAEQASGPPPRFFLERL